MFDALHVLQLGEQGVVVILVDCIQQVLSAAAVLTQLRHRLSLLLHSKLPAL